MTERVLIVCRQSLTREDSVSLDAQEAALREMAAARQWHVVDVLSAASTRGWWEVDKRDELTEAMLRAERHEYDILLIWSIDRLARSVRILENVAHNLQKHGVTIVSKGEEWASDAFLRQIAGALAEKFSRDLAAHVRGAALERTKQGRQWGRPPYGYRKVDKCLVICPDEAVIVVDIYQRTLVGETTVDICVALEAQGIPPPRGTRWTTPTIRKILRNPVYMGRIRHRGTVYPGTHEPIIDQTTWERTQRLWRRLLKRRRKPVPSWLDGCVEHSCGAPMYLIPIARPNRAIRATFVCSTRPREPFRRCHQGQYSVSSTKLELVVRECLARDAEAMQSVAVADAHSRAEQAAGGTEAVTMTRAIHKRRADLLGQRARIDDLYQRGSRPLAWFQQRDAVIATELAALDAQAAQLPSVPSVKDLKAAVTWLRGISGAIRQADGATLRTAMIDLDAMVVVSVDGISLRYRGPYAALIEQPSVVRLGKSKRAIERNVGAG